MPAADSAEPPQFELRPVASRAALATLRQINAVVLAPATTYSDAWYRATLALPHPALAQLAYYAPAGVPAGAIRCALDTATDGARSIYIMTIAVLAPFRGMGAGALLLAQLVEFARSEGIRRIYLHVHAQAVAAMAWYTRRGFRSEGLEPGYYRRRVPPEDAYIYSLLLD